MTISSIRELETKGYLTLSKFVQYLKDYAPEAYISYPTALKLVKQGKIRARRVGGPYRIGRGEVERWIAEGAWERDLSSPYSTTF